LHKTRTKTVPGSGNPQAKIVIIGESPGSDEDQQGLPFVGKSGQKLTEMLKSAGINREDAFITNSVKCRPPGNRNPEPNEIQACNYYLWEQLRIISPEIVITLGKFASGLFFTDNCSMSEMRRLSLRGIIFWTGEDRTSYKIISTYHPAYILRNANEEETVVGDLIRAKKFIEENNGKKS
jgi:DNA polymerase